MKQFQVVGTALNGSTVAKRSIHLHPEVAAMPKELRIHVDPGGLIDLHRSMTDEWSPYRADWAIWQFRRLLTHATSGENGRYGSQQIDQWVGEGELQSLSKKLFYRLISHNTEGSWTGIEGDRNVIYETVPHTTPEAREEVAEAIREFVDGLYQARNPEASAWVEDSPYASQFADRLYEIFPEMVFVHIHRHPWDVLKSHMTRRQDRGGWTADTPEANALRIRNLMKGWWAIRENLPEDRYVEVGLDDLARDTDLWMERIFDRAGMDWKHGLWTPLDPDQNTKGRFKLTEEEQNATYLLEPVMEEYGYETP